MSGFASAHHVLTFGAAGARGQTAAITALLERHGAYIEEFTVFDDVLSGRFYLRTAFRLVEPGATALATMGREYEALRAHYADAEGAIHDQQRPMRVLLMVSKADHCLRGLLDQWRRGELKMDIVGIASNHADLAPLAAELSAILGFMEQLAEVDVSQVEPMTSVTPMPLPWREDAVTDGGYPERVLANAPDAHDGFFTVPKVVE